MRQIRKASDIDQVLEIRRASNSLKVNEACAFKCEDIAEALGWRMGDMRTFALKKRLKITPIPVAEWFAFNTEKCHGGLLEPNRDVRMFVNRKYDCGRGCELIFYYIDGKANK